MDKKKKIKKQKEHSSLKSAKRHYFQNEKGEEEEIDYSIQNLEEAIESEEEILQDGKITYFINEGYQATEVDYYDQEDEVEKNEKKMDMIDQYDEEGSSEDNWEDDEDEESQGDEEENEGDINDSDFEEEGEDDEMEDAWCNYDYQKDDGTKISLTVKRGGNIYNNIQKFKKMKEEEISINVDLKSKHLNENELKFIMKFLGEYRISLEKYISSGGEADVFLGKILYKDGRQVEKVFRIVKAFNQEQISQVKGEFQKVASMEFSRNIASYDSMFQINGIFIFIINNFPNCLKNLMNTKLTNDQFWMITFDLFDGLIELKTHHIIHSDIKPSNVLINSKDNCFYSDFGMALKLNMRQRSTHKNLGLTLKYCSPESQNGQNLSYSSDMYSLGIVIKELTELLEDKAVTYSIQLFLKEKVLLENPDQRILAEDLIPCFIAMNSLVIDKEFVNKYLKKVKYIICESQFDQEKYICIKMLLSYQFVAIMLIYIIHGKSDLISFISLSDVSFQPFPHKQIVRTMIDIVELKGDLLSMNKKQIFIEQALIDLESLPIDEDTILNKVKAELSLGNILTSFGNEEKAQEHFLIALNFQQKHNPTNHFILSTLYNCIGDSLILLNKKEEGKQMILKSIEECQFHKKKQLLIEQFFYLANCYENENDQSNSLKYYQEVVNNWRQQKNFIQRRMLPSFSSNYLQLIAQSFGKLGQYVDSIKIWIEYLKTIHHQSENLENYQLQHQFQIIKSSHNIPSQQFNKILKVISNLQNKIVKQLLLLEIGVYYLEIEDFKSALDALLECNSINKETAPLIIQIQIKIYLYQCFSKMKNVNEADKIQKEASFLINQPEVMMNGGLLLTSIVLMHLRISFEGVSDDVIKWYLNAKEKYKSISFYHKSQQDQIEVALNWVESRYQEYIQQPQKQ